MQRKRYDDEFRRDAVELLLTGQRALKPLARELGITPVTLRRWRDRRLAELDCTQGPPGGPASRDMAEELRRLHQENETLRRQREILKKALGILSEQPPRGMP